MKRTNTIFSALLASCLLTVLPFGPAGCVAALNETSPSSVSGAVEAIRQAAEPSGAIEAYAAALAADPTGRLQAQQAFLQRMVDFGLPEMAGTQAVELMQRDPNNGLAWGVAAYVSAKRDQSPQALAEIANAVRLAPSNVFVLRTAGQLLAWYDTRADRTQIPGDAQSAAEITRRQLANNSTYLDAYKSAVDAYKRTADATSPGASGETAAASSTTASPGAEEAGAAPAYAPAPLADYGDYGMSAPAVYPNPYYYAYAGVPNVYASWWPTPCQRNDWWWPTFTNIIVVNRNCPPRFRDRDDFVFFHRHNTLGGPLLTPRTFNNTSFVTNSTLIRGGTQPLFTSPTGVLDPPRRSSTNDRIINLPRNITQVAPTHVAPVTPTRVLSAAPIAPRINPPTVRAAPSPPPPRARVEMPSVQHNTIRVSPPNPGRNIGLGGNQRSGGTTHVAVRGRR